VIVIEKWIKLKPALMSTSLLKCFCIVALFSACSRNIHSNKQKLNKSSDQSSLAEQPVIGAEQKPQSLMNLPQTQDGGFVLAPGFYEAEFKSYCLQPGTPDPRQGDAYLQSPVTGYRKDIIETALLNSRARSDIDQRNIQLLLWSAVSGSDFNKLSYSVQNDARKLLTPKQIFELQGGVIGLIKTVSNQTGLLNTNNSIKNLFELGTSSYESFERLAVLREPSKITKQGIKYDTWYKQKENYYVRYFPLSYQKLKIQVFVPDSLFDNEGKVDGEYLVFDPTGQQAVPAFTNAQRLGIGAPVIIDVVRKVIQVKKRTETEKELPRKENKKTTTSKTNQPAI
jgi:hypothetical protein